MIIAIDVILVLIIVVSVIVGIKQGFIKSVVGFLRYIIAYIIANALYSPTAVLSRKLVGLEAESISEEKTGIITFIKALPEKISGVDTETAREMFISALFDIVMFILIFVVTLFIIRLITFIIEKGAKLPGLSFTNRFLGGVFGIFCGLLWTWILASLFSNYLLGYLVEKYPDIFYEEMRDDFLVNFCANTNPLTYLFNAIDAIASLLHM